MNDSGDQKNRVPASNSRGIVIYRDKILIIERWRYGKHYISLPGGDIESGESSKRTAVREIYEETCIKVQGVKLAYQFLNSRNGRAYDIWICKYISGEPQLPESSEEYRATNTFNRYEPKWLTLSEVKQSKLWPSSLKLRLLDDYNNNWPTFGILY